MVKGVAVLLCTVSGFRQGYLIPMSPSEHGSQGPLGGENPVREGRVPQDLTGPSLYSVLPTYLVHRSQESWEFTAHRNPGSSGAGRDISSSSPALLFFCVTKYVAKMGQGHGDPDSVLLLPQAQR